MDSEQRTDQRELAKKSKGIRIPNFRLNRKQRREKGERGELAEIISSEAAFLKRKRTQRNADRKSLTKQLLTTYQELFDIVNNSETPSEVAEEALAEMQAVWELMSDADKRALERRLDATS